MLMEFFTLCRNRIEELAHRFTILTGAK